MDSVSEPRAAPIDAIGEVGALFAGPEVDPSAVANLLDSLSHAQRVQAVRSLGRSEQRRLYAAVDEFRPLRLVDLVPPQVADFETVRHLGRNTLPAFTHFEKHFCRPPGVDGTEPDHLYGFNFQRLSGLTGPGYFLARSARDETEVEVDYNVLPPDHPVDWPAIQPNDRGLSRFVYGYMVDTLRRVSEHVSIGSAARRGRDMGSWFVLCRDA
ncbi:hypothetical protein MK489_12270 [Myxococcota bacterium]|nr:hypothetical protein [Myxococcota bacterium]